MSTSSSQITRVREPVKGFTIRSGPKAKDTNISIIVPLYNEAGNLSLFYDKLNEVCGCLPESYIFIFVNDGSTDGSASVLELLAKADARVRVVEFTRNFGKEVALTAGIHAAKDSDAAILIDADLQHPVELIPEFIAKWRAGAETVVGVRKSYLKEGLRKKLSSWAYYKIINAVAETKIVPHGTDYRLIDRSVIEAFSRFSERQRITRGLIDWLGFRQDFIYFDTPERQYGTAGYSLRKLIRLAMNSLVSMSLFPLRLAGWLGIFITVSASVLGIAVIVEKYGLRDPLRLHVSGTAILVDTNMLLMGIVLMALGLVALYIANIHIEVSNRPLYVTREDKSYHAFVLLANQGISSGGFKEEP